MRNISTSSKRARSEYIRCRGMSYSEVEKRGILLPVREARCRYRAPARYDDLVQVHAASANGGARRSSLYMRCE